MTSEQKSEITALRQQGYGYLKIANHLGVTVGSVKSFCQRNGLRVVKTDMDIPKAADAPLTNLEAAENFCKGCGVPIMQTPHARKKLFCSTTCRQKWWNEHLDLVERKAIYDFTCTTCGKEFTAYGNKKRKYCCRDCYLADRFGRRGR